jgi:DNA-binding response OmpR family regulator
VDQTPSWCSARGQESDKIAALDAGRMTTCSKPFGIGELLARMRVALRHAARTPEAESACAFGDVRLIWSSVWSRRCRGSSDAAGVQVAGDFGENETGL